VTAVEHGRAMLCGLCLKGFEVESCCRSGRKMYAVMISRQAGWLSGPLSAYMFV